MYVFSGGSVFAYILLYQTYRHKSISKWVVSSNFLPVSRAIFTRWLFFPIVPWLRTSLGSWPVNTSLRDYRATMSAYALAHFTYRNSKPPFSNDRRPWISVTKDFVFRGKTRSLSFSFFSLIDRRKKKIVRLIFHRWKVLILLSR